MASALPSLPSAKTATPERSLVVSPLLNVAPAAGTGATLRHTRRILELGESRIAGSATLSLSPDRRTIDIVVDLDRPRAVTVRLRRLELDSGSGGRPDENLLVAEILPGAPSNVESRIASRFSLDRRLGFATFADFEDLLRAGVRLSELRSGSVEGVHVEPATSVLRRGQGRLEYLKERMLTEIGAAECSATVVAASRHVELATLYARRLRGSGSQLR